MGYGVKKDANLATIIRKMSNCTFIVIFQKVEVVSKRIMHKIFHDAISSEGFEIVYDEIAAIYKI